MMFFNFSIDFYSFFWYNHKCCETLAQLAEHTPFKRRVEGSNPSCLTNNLYYYKARRNGLYFLDYSNTTNYFIALL